MIQRAKLSPTEKKAQSYPFTLITSSQVGLDDMQ